MEELDLAILRFLRGDSSRIDMNTTPFDDGNFYLTIDDGGFYVDVKDSNENEHRLQLNCTPLLLHSVYPVGSIYMSVVNTNPYILFGFGTWEQIQDTFLLASGNIYSAGSTGGEATHTLTTAEMPSHKHTVTLSENGVHTHKIGTDKDVDYLAGGDCWSVHNNSSGASYLNGYTSSAGSHTHTATVTNTGSGTAHNNMPPYLAVYVWKRTS